MENSPLRMSKPESKKKLFLVVGLLSCISIAIAIAFLTYDGEPQVLPTGVVSSDSSECSTLGVDILKSGGSAIDAVISATLCMGVIHPHHTGIGGGGYLMTFSRKKADKAESSVFSFVERAGSNSSAQSVVGSGVPGVLYGLNLAHQRFGKLSWKQLLSPVVKLARDGVSVGESLSTSLSDESEFSDEVKDVFFIDGKPVQKGQILKQAHLAETLEIVSKFGANAFYSGTLAHGIVQSFQQHGISFTEADLSSYKGYEEKPLTLTSDGITYMTANVPSGGPELLSIINILRNYEAVDNVLEIHRMNEAIKLARGQFSLIGDPLFNNESLSLVESMVNRTNGRIVADQIRDDSVGPIFETLSESLKSQVGSVVVAVDADETIAISVTSLTSMFGSKLFAKSGFFLNNALDNFALENESTKGESENHQAPRKRPLSHLTPLIAVEGPYACGLRVALGSSDPGQLAQVVSTYFHHGRNLSASIETARFMPGKDQGQILIEEDKPGSLTDIAIDKLSQLRYFASKVKFGFTSINAAHLVGDSLISHADSRGGGFSVRLA
ncbi:glutathione hydrolase 7-like [Artemia franciscana]|uniref:Uncharacterized protein n=1 Tax=Artemia franciscana TaxID=6661 RepID=A0AA88IR12_ARTSF|nr:hypothetical protein QYM36_001558 [Artemia franciscana]